MCNHFSFNNFRALLGKPLKRFLLPYVMQD